MGVYEGHELRDGGCRCTSTDVSDTVKKINMVLADAAMGMDDPPDQRAIVAPANLAHMLRRYDVVQF